MIEMYVFSRSGNVEYRTKACNRGFGHVEDGTKACKKAKGVDGHVWMRLIHYLATTLAPATWGWGRVGRHWDQRQVTLGFCWDSLQILGSMDAFECTI